MKSRTERIEALRKIAFNGRVRYSDNELILELMRLLSVVEGKRADQEDTATITELARQYWSDIEANHAEFEANVMQERLEMKYPKTSE